MMENKIYEVIPKIMDDIGAVGKNQKNAQQGFMFRGIDAVMNAINPALVKYKVFVVPQILEQSREERKTAKGGNLIYSICKIKYTFYAEDGSYIEAITVGEGMDSGDKATNKAMAIAFKYACFQVFCIPTEEMKDPDAECHNVQPKQPDVEAINDAPIDQTKINSLLAIMERKGVSQKAIHNRYEIKKLEDMSLATYIKCMAALEKTPDKE